MRFFYNAATQNRAKIMRQVLPTITFQSRPADFVALLSSSRPPAAAGNTGSGAGSPPRETDIQFKFQAERSTAFSMATVASAHRRNQRLPSRFSCSNGFDLCSSPETTGQSFVQVAFTHVLDMFEFCTPELQTELRAPRMAFRAAEDKKQGIAPGSNTAAAAGALIPAISSASFVLPADCHCSTACPLSLQYL